MLEKIVTIILCHLIGDYVLQSNYLATNKGRDWYLLLVHSALYCIPFIFAFGMNISVFIMFICHVIIDSLKARYDKIGIWEDQIMHYVVAVWCLL